MIAPTADARRPMVPVQQYGPSQRSAWLDVEWRRHQRWVMIEDRPVNVIDIGPTDPEHTEDSGPEALVWIHGLSGSWQNWLENLPLFARRRRCIAIDLPGFGASPMPTQRISIPGYARVVDELLHGLGIERAVVVGNSMGGFVGAELAIAFGTRVDRLVLVAPAGISIQDQFSGRALSAVRAAGGALALTMGWLASRSQTLARRPGSRRAMLSIVAAHPSRLPAPLVSEQLRGAGKPGFVDALEAMAGYALGDRLPAITAPTLVVWGEKDHIVPVRDAEAFGDLIPGTRVVIYEDTGHVPMMERPEAFNALLQEFLGDEPA